MLRGPGEVMDFVWVIFQVVQLLLRLAGRHEELLFGSKFAFFMQMFHDRQRRISAFFIRIGLGVGALGHEVADILVTIVTHAADAVHSFVAAITRAEDISALLRLWAEKDLSLHVLW